MQCMYVLCRPCSQLRCRVVVSRIAFYLLHPVLVLALAELYPFGPAAELLLDPYPVGPASALVVVPQPPLCEAVMVTVWVSPVLPALAVVVA